ncbi:hypothetical protein D9M71_374210 [compost metagenome]
MRQGNAQPKQGTGLSQETPIEQATFQLTDRMLQLLALLQQRLQQDRTTALQMRLHFVQRLACQADRQSALHAKKRRPHRRQKRPGIFM